MITKIMDNNRYLEPLSLFWPPVIWALRAGSRKWSSFIPGSHKIFRIGDVLPMPSFICHNDQMQCALIQRETFNVINKEKETYGMTFLRKVSFIHVTIFYNSRIGAVGDTCFRFFLDRKIFSVGKVKLILTLWIAFTHSRRSRNDLKQVFTLKSGDLRSLLPISSYAN